MQDQVIEDAEHDEHGPAAIGSFAVGPFQVQKFAYDTKNEKFQKSHKDQIVDIFISGVDWWIFTNGVDWWIFTNGVDWWIFTNGVDWWIVASGRPRIEGFELVLK